MVGWLIIGVCLIAVMILWYQYDKKEREFKNWLNEVKRRGEDARKSKRNGED